MLGDFLLLLPRQVHLGVLQVLNLALEDLALLRLHLSLAVHLLVSTRLRPRSGETLLDLLKLALHRLGAALGRVDLGLLELLGKGLLLGLEAVDLIHETLVLVLHAVVERRSRSWSSWPSCASISPSMSSRWSSRPSASPETFDPDAVARAAGR